MSTGNVNRYDLTQGNIINKLLLVALPIIGTQFIQMSYNLTDMFLLGRVGSDAVAASGTAGMYLWLSNGLLMIGRMGAEIGVSQNLGRRDLRAARKYAQNSMFLALILGLFLMVVYMAFSKSLIGFFNIREIHVAHDARIYLMITAMAIPATFLSGVVAGTFNASGNSRVPLLINACGLGLNIILDPVFIFALGLGVKGAAIATLIAQVVVCLLSLLALIKRKDRPFVKFLFFSKPEKKASHTDFAVEYSHRSGEYVIHLPHHVYIPVCFRLWCGSYCRIPGWKSGGITELADRSGLFNSSNGFCGTKFRSGKMEPHTSGKPDILSFAFGLGYTRNTGFIFPGRNHIPVVPAGRRIGEHGQDLPQNTGHVPDHFLS